MQVNHRYFPHTKKDIEEMLALIGKEKVEDLFKTIPKDKLIKGELDLPNALSERELYKRIENDSNLNKKLVSFLGAGAYESYTPAAVKTIASRQEFLTSYTPYQAEISQGTLQYIFEFQSLVCELTGMDASNASMYDGATATVEAIFMAVVHTKRNKVLIADTINPNTLEVIRTYLKYRNIEIVLVKNNNFLVCLNDLKEKLDSDVAAFVLQTPNFFGLLEELEVRDLLDQYKSLFIVNSPLNSLSVLKSPGEMKADIACGEAQSMGLSLAFGGPYLGYLACKSYLVRKLPGRIVGLTNDIEGRRAFVLTLQAREQHIRREKASSNICSNQSLMALQVLLYAMLMGKNGLVNSNLESLSKAHYLYNELLKIKGFKKVTNHEFFNEFVIYYDGDIDKLNSELLKNDILGGLNLSKVSNELKNHLLLCVTYTKTKEELDNFLKVVRGIK